MPVLKLNLDGDGAANDLHEAGLTRIHLGEGAAPIRVTYLPGGMASGKPSVALIFELPDKQTYVIAETSASLFVLAGRMIASKAAQEGHEL